MPKMIDFPGPLNSGIPLHYHILSVLAFPTEERNSWNKDSLFHYTGDVRF